VTSSRDTLTPLSMQTERPSRFPFAPFPIGWFRVASSAEVRPGRIHNVRAFGTELVLTRLSGGPVRAFDAHCPHLGAHVGVGGKIVDGTLRCPFHGWRFDGSGACVSVPGAQRIPPAARLGAWSVREWAGQVMVYHHPRRAEPSWELPELPEYGARDWCAFRHANRWTIRTHVQELAENGVDISHFPFLHCQQTAEIRTESLTTEGPLLHHRTFQRYAIFGLAKLWAKEVLGPLDISLCGPGVAINRASVRVGLDLSYVYVFFFTPIDVERVALWSMLTLKKVGNPLLHRILWAKARSEGGKTIDQDIPIWENKRYRERPLLSEVDGPVMAYRRWARQFYDDGLLGAEKAAAPSGTVC